MRSIMLTERVFSDTFCQGDFSLTLRDALSFATRGAYEKPRRELFRMFDHVRINV